MAEADADAPLPEQQEENNSPDDDQHKGEAAIAAMANQRCHKCLQYGHIGKNCPKGSNALKIDRCFKCGKAGHRARECRVRGSLNAFGPTAAEEKILTRKDEGGSTRFIGERGRGFGGSRGSDNYSGRGRSRGRGQNTPLTLDALDSQLAKYAGVPAVTQESLDNQMNAFNAEADIVKEENDAAPA